MSFDYEKQAMGFELNDTFRIQRIFVGKYLRRLNSPKPTLDVLDLGCGAGFGTKAVFQNLANGLPELDIIGLDISETALQKYSQVTGLKGVTGSVIDTQFKENYFDLILFDDVIEHLVETDLAIREIYRILSPEGVLLLATPNLASWFNRLALLFGIQPAFSEVSSEKIYGRPGTEVVGHLRLFTLRALTQMLTQEGFTVREIKSSVFDALPNYLAPIDRIFAGFPSLGANLILVCEKN
jgi:2-polyprenyl-3-methyl-5-hydroxy-6-metoxy-1,4-benzoquinol methylase